MTDALVVGGPPSRRAAMRSWRTQCQRRWTDASQRTRHPDSGGCADHLGPRGLQLLAQHPSPDCRPADTSGVYQPGSGNRPRTRRHQGSTAQTRTTHLRPARRLHGGDSADGRSRGGQRDPSCSYVGHVLGLPGRPSHAAVLCRWRGGDHFRIESSSGAKGWP